MKKLALILALIVALSCTFATAAFADEATPSFYNVAIGACEGRGYAAITDGNTETSWTFDCGDIVVDFGEEYILESEINLVKNGDVKVTRYAGKDGSWVYATPVAGDTLQQIVLTDYTYYNTGGSGFSDLYEIVMYGTRKGALAGTTHNALIPDSDSVWRDGDETTVNDIPVYFTVVWELDAVYDIDDLTLQVVGGQGGNNPGIDCLHTSKNDSEHRDRGNWVRIVLARYGASTAAEVKVMAPTMTTRNVLVQDSNNVLIDGDDATSKVCDGWYTAIFEMDDVYDITDLSLEVNGGASPYIQGIQETATGSYSGSGSGRYIRVVLNANNPSGGAAAQTTVNEVRVLTSARQIVSGGNVTYDANGGTGSQTDDYDYQAGAQVAAKDAGTIKKDNCIFVGWSENPDATAASYLIGSRIEITGDVTLYAVFVPIAAVEFTATGDSGYYADFADSTDKLGKVIFNSEINDFAGYTDMFGILRSQLTDFGFYIYNSAELSEVKATLNSSSFDVLVSEDGKFFCSVVDIAEADFGKTVVAVPYAVISGNAYTGTAIPMTVTATEDNWLGPIED